MGRASAPAAVQRAARSPAWTGSQVEFTLEIEHVGTGQPDETAEGDGVVKAKPVRVLFLQQCEVIREFFPCHFHRRLFGKERISQEDQDRRNNHQAEDGAPAIRGRNAGSQERIKDGADVARASQAHHDALQARWIPAPRLRKGDGETGPRKAKHRAQQQGRLIILQADEPGAKQPGDDDDLRGDPRGFRSKTVHSPSREQSAGTRRTG